MNPDAQPPRMISRCTGEQPGCEMLHGASAMHAVVESSGDQSWTDFCATLNRNAFLLAESGFAGLEQA